MSEARKPLLLVVDDDRTIRKLLARVAERAGFEVDAAKDGAEALQMLAAKEYSIAIVDLMMPRISGYELVQKIGAMQPHPAVIVATAMSNGDLSTLDDTMVRRVIRKPFDIEVVANALVETAREIARRRAVAETGVVLPDNAVVASDATIRVDNVTIVADHATIISDDVTIMPNAEQETPAVPAERVQASAEEAAPADPAVPPNEKPSPES